MMLTPLTAGVLSGVNRPGIAITTRYFPARIYQESTRTD
jgi:hypothetical protein